jgi:SsrA-binding protein
MTKSAANKTREKLIASKRPATSAPVIKMVAENKRALHEYKILETLECGVELKGAEVKSIRAHGLSLKESYAQVKNGELVVINLNIPKYEYAKGFGDFDPKRVKKLLANKREIDALYGKTSQQSLTLVPLRMYFKNGKLKLELALAQGKKIYDKRRDLMEKQQRREIEREITRRTKLLNN